MALFEHGYGLIIGVSAYSDPTLNVPIAEGDAQELYATLTDPAVAAYPRGQVQLLLGAAATRERIGEELRVLSTKAGPDDTVFISFTGHGALGEDMLYYLGASDTSFVAGQAIGKGSGYSVANLAAALRAIQAQKVLVVINACASGHLSNLATHSGLRDYAGSVIPERGSNELLASGRGRALITASRPDELAYFRSGDSLSYFGRALIDALRGSAVDPSSGFVGLFELYGALFKQVQRTTTALGLQQHPRLNLVDGEGPFPVALYPGKTQGDSRRIQQTPPADTDVERIQLQITDNRKLIDFGSAQIGSVTFRGDVAQGDIIKTYHGTSGANDDVEQLDPLHELQKLSGQVATARNVDEFARNNAAFQLSQARLALSQGNSTLARQYLDAGLLILDAMKNGYVNSLTRKLRKIAEAL